MTTSPTFAQVECPEHADLARELFREYEASIGVDLEYQGFGAELAALPAPYVPPHGALLLAWIDDAPAGCVALRPLEPGIGEMKRLYVRPAFRASGLGRRLVGHIIQSARDAGCRALRLDTLASMDAAQALYRRLGFVEIPAYNRTHLPGTRFFELDLGR